MQLPERDKHRFISSDRRGSPVSDISDNELELEVDPVVQTQNRQANASGMPPVWNFVFSPSLSYHCDGRSLLLHILNICIVLLER